MFLWARLVLQYLSTNLFSSKGEVIGAVDTLPHELSKMCVCHWLESIWLTRGRYGAILSRILSNFDDRSKSRVRSILGWIAFARRPLRKAELRSALFVASDGDDVHAHDLVPSYWFDMCTPLIEERNDSTFGFIHSSVKEYVVRPRS
jgi:hypothetical protein